MLDSIIYYKQQNRETFRDGLILARKCFILGPAKLKPHQSSPLKSEKPAKVEEDLPDLRHKDIENVTKKIQLASKSKKPLDTPQKPSKLPVVVATTEPLRSEDAAKEKEDLPNLQDKDVERVAKKMQIAFKSKRLPKAKVELLVSDKVVEPVSQSVSINAALGKIEILENEISKLQMELEDSRKQVKLYKDKLDRCRCQTKRIQMPNHKGDTLNL